MNKYALYVAALGLCLSGCANEITSEPQDPEKVLSTGRSLANNICQRCHDVSPNASLSEERIPGVPPSFVLVAQKRDLDAKRLRQFVRFPHGEMDTLTLTNRETDAVIAYIVSLRRR